MTARIGGYLTLDRLRDGDREQYAARRHYGTVNIELGFEGDHFIVSERITKPGVESTSTCTTHPTLGEAHLEFERLVRKHQPINPG